MYDQDFSPLAIIHHCMQVILNCSNAQKVFVVACCFASEVFKTCLTSYRHLSQLEGIQLEITQ